MTTNKPPASSSSPDVLSDQKTRLSASQKIEYGHNALVIVLISMAPLVYLGAPLGADGPILAILTGLGWALCLLQWLRSERPGLRWTAGGLIAGALVLWLAIAAWRSPSPLSGWGHWTMWCCLLLYAGYLQQVLPERKALAWAALTASAGVQIILALMQRVVVLPKLSAAVRRGDEQVHQLVDIAGAGKVMQRLTDGGVYGSFALANSLGAWVMMIAAPLAWLFWRETRRLREASSGKPNIADPGYHHGQSLIVCGFLLAGLLAVVVSTESKGALAAAAVALVWLAWIRLGKPWLRVGSAVVACAVLIVAVVSIGDQIPSVSVRLGYWRAAMLAWWHASPLDQALGLGIGSYEIYAPQHFRPEDEFARLPHSGVVNALVIGGPVALLLLAGLLLRWIWPRPSDSPAVIGDPTNGHHADASEEPEIITGTNAPAPQQMTSLQRGFWVMLVALPYFVVLGTLSSDNLFWWPGGDQLLVRVTYGFALAGLHWWVLRQLITLPTPTARMAQLGVLIFAVSCLIDFQWHSSGVVATAITLAVLAQPASTAHALATCRTQRACVSVAILAALSLAVLIALSWPRAAHNAQTRQISDSLQRFNQSAEHASSSDQQALQTAADNLRHWAGSKQADTPRDLYQLVQADTLHSAQQAWPRDFGLELTLALQGIDPLERQRQVEALTANMPWSYRIWRQLARAASINADWSTALRAQRQAVATYPAKLQYRRELLRLLDVLEESGYLPLVGLSTEQVAAERSRQREYLFTAETTASHSHR